MTAQSPLKIALMGGAGVATLGTLLALIVDPTARAHARLEAIEQVSVDKLGGPRSGAAAASLAQTPIFVMTTGAGAYKEKTFQLFGIAISPKRRAALVAIDGAPPEWLSAGAVSGDARLVDVGSNGVVFETPVGQRTVTLSDPTPASSTSSGTR